MKKLYALLEKIVYVVLKPMFKLVGKELTDEAFQAFMQFVRFGIVGVSNTLISYILYSGSLLIFQKLGILLKFDYVLAQAISFVLSVLWSFFWNNKLVFVKGEDEHRNLFKTLLKTYVSYSFSGLFVSSALLVLWVDVLGISEFIAPLLNLVVTVPMNFLINKFWAFKTSKVKDVE